jgi:hypothetical protein
VAIILALTSNTGDASRDRRSLRVLLLVAPVVFIAHFLEEGPQFVAWFNAHVSRGITEPLFWSVNYSGLAITLAVVVLEWLSGSALSAVVVVAWLSFLMFANALLHIVGAVVDGAYVPGLVTAIVLYLPLYALVVARVIREQRLPRTAVGLAAIAGAIPMCVHGYLIIFRGSRLF